jgi:hypothetical protein
MHQHKLLQLGKQQNWINCDIFSNKSVYFMKQCSLKIQRKQKESSQQLDVLPVAAALFIVPKHTSIQLHVAKQLNN